ncbi:MAG: hypothetical protein WBV61_13100 [Rhodanobacteraceae bacterium]
MYKFALRLASTFSMFAVFAVAPAFAQWSSDPANNLTIADRSGEQAQPKIVPTPDGGFYISWFDNSAGGYDVFLQRLDAQGNEQFPHNGILVADRDFSSTQDYGLDVDADGNALLAYRLDQSSPQIVAQKVAPDGSLLWTPGGIVVSNDAGGANSPKISATGDGTVGVAWSGSDGSIVVQKLSGAGSVLWGPNGVSILPPSGFFFLADLHGDADGDLIASWGAQLSTFDRELWAQKLAAADGSALWGSDPVEVFSGTNGALQFGYFPPFIADGAGGAVFVWYTVGSNEGIVRVQHVMADGSQAFTQNGVFASTDATQNHFEPSGAYDANSGDIYAVWRETDLMTQSQIGIYAQRIDGAGDRQWGDGGQVLVPLGSTDQTQVRALPLAGGFLAAWVSNDSPSPMPIHVASVNADGSYAFPGDVVDIKTAPTDTSRLFGAISANGYAAYTWTDNDANFNGDIKAQNINFDGSLGNPDNTDTIFANGFD